MTYCIGLGKITYDLDFEKKPVPQLEAVKPIIMVTDRDRCIMDEGEVARLIGGEEKGEFVLTFCAA